MKKIYAIIVFITLLAGCNKDNAPAPSDKSDFSGKYFYAAKDHESGDYAAMDLIITVDGANVNVSDDFADPSNMGPGTISGNSLTVKQHVEDNYDTRDIVLVMTNKDGIMFFTYDVDFTQATGDYNIEGILAKQ